MNVPVRTLSDETLIVQLRKESISLMDAQLKLPFIAEALARLLERGTKGQQ